MISSDNLCMSCMKEIGDEKKCPHCGYHSDTVQNAPYLPIRTVINNRYLVGKVHNSDGEGATYIGWDIKEKKAVNIREFMPDSFTTRVNTSLNLQVLLGSENSFAEMRRSFEELWSKLVKLNGLSALINVTDVLEDYGTSYAVYDHFDGISLRDFLLRSKTGYISWDKARQLLMPTLSTLGTLHQNGIIHRGISPTTLIIAEDGKIKITGFSISELRTVGSRLNPKISEGYAAVEQYGFEAPQGPWTDIYSFSAVLYRTLIGSDPISSKERMSNDRLMVPGKFAEALPAYVINGLINGLQILPQDRTRNVEQLRAELSATPSATAAGVSYKKPQAPAQQSRPQQPAQAAKSGQKKKKKKKSSVGVLFMTMFIMIIVGTVIFGALALTVFKDKFDFSALGITESTTAAQVEQVPVPQFTDRSYYDVDSNPVFKSNFKIIKEEVYNSAIEPGYIISQSISADTMVDKGTQIVLYVSKGNEKSVLPNVVGKSFDEVEAQLTELGFVVVKQETSDGSYGVNEIIMMSPAADKSYNVGTEVKLMVFVPEPEIPQNEEPGMAEDNLYSEESYEQPEASYYSEPPVETAP